MYINRSQIHLDSWKERRRYRLHFVAFSSTTTGLPCLRSFTTKLPALPYGIESRNTHVVNEYRRLIFRKEGFFTASWVAILRKSGSLAARSTRVRVRFVSSIREPRSAELNSC